MFNQTRFQGPSERFGPVAILKELDRLLLLAGWTRTGFNPNSLTESLTIGSTGDVNMRAETFGYKHPTANEHIWFRTQRVFYRSGANFESVLALAINVHGATWTSAIPDQAYHLAANARDTAQQNRNADWFIGAGDDGFYVVQTELTSPGGFVVERIPETGNWLVQYVDSQYRGAGTWTGVNLKYFQGTGNQWYSGGIQGGILKVTTDTQAWYKGVFSNLELTFGENNYSSQVITPNGALLRGYWYHRPDEVPFTSNLVRRYFAPYLTVQTVEGTETKTFGKVSSYNNNISNLSWRVS